MRKQLVDLIQQIPNATGRPTATPMALPLVAPPTKPKEWDREPVVLAMGKALDLALAKANLNHNHNRLTTPLTGDFSQKKQKKLPTHTRKTTPTRPTTTHPSSIPSPLQTRLKRRPTLPAPAQTSRSPRTSRRTTTPQPTIKSQEKHQLHNNLQPTMKR